MTGRVVVVGGGITGLAAAHHLVTVSPELEVLVLEATDRTGGKLRWGRVGPLVVDAGADGFLARQPEMAELVREIGLGDELVAPATGQAYIWARDALRPIPTPSVLGVPLDPDTVAATGIVGAEAVVELRRRLRADLAPLEGDATIGSVLRPRLGDEVFDMLVDPLLGGINAGAGDQMSIEASALQLADAARAGGSFAVALRGGVSDAAAAAGGPVFLGVRGGTGRVVESLRAELGPCVRLSSPVARVASGGSSWLVTARGGDVSADAVILTTPAPVTSRLLAPLAPAAADLIGAIELADAVLVTFVLPAGGIDHPLDGSGFLVPRATGLLMTACSWSSSKWEHYHDGVHTVLRVSAGRTDDTRWLDLDEPELVARLRAELATTMGVTVEPVAIRVTDWRASLPQYRPGHLRRVAEVEAELAAVAPGVFATGAAFRGLGLPACVRQGRAAAASAIAHLG